MLSNDIVASPIEFLKTILESPVNTTKLHLQVCKEKLQKDANGGSLPSICSMTFSLCSK